MQWTKFLVLGYYDGKEVKNFYAISDFIKFLFGNSEVPCDIFAHFGGRFDFLFLIQDVLENFPSLKIEDIIPMGSGMLSLTLRKGKKKITFRDSSALLPFSLKKITESFHVSHIKQEWDHSKTKGVTKKLLLYLEYDLKGLYESLEKYYSEELIKNAGFAYTQAGQALKILRCYIKEPICSLSNQLDSQLRPGFYGGRTEIFKPYYKGKKPLFCFDVNSLYPTAMLENEFPNEFEHETDTFEKNKLGIYFCDVVMPPMYIPPLGITYKHKYIFPVGKFSGYFTSAEIEYSKTLGAKFKIKNGWIFSNGGKFFENFISSLYRIRKETTDPVRSTIAKLLMNSAYGRFALNRERENLVFDDGSCGLTPFKEIKAGKNTYRLMLKDVDLKSFSNIAIACFITSYARIYMHKLMMTAPNEMYYTDTDSMYTTHEFTSSKELGALKLEDTVESACFLLPKTYIAGNKIVMKGFDKKKIQHFTFDDFVACLEGDIKINNLKIQNEPKFATFKTALRKGFVVGMTEKSTRQIRSRYDKREIFKSGATYDSKPYNLRGNENE